eukprot:4232956-Amphidinium_carterae.1
MASSAPETMGVQKEPNTTNERSTPAVRILDIWNGDLLQVVTIQCHTSHFAFKSLIYLTVLHLGYCQSVACKFDDLHIFSIQDIVVVFAVAKALKNKESAHLAWHNINYSVKVGKGRKELLKSVSGELKPGSLTCILGPSGSGLVTCPSRLLPVD